MSTIYTNKDVASMCRALILQYNALHDSVAVADGYSTNHYHRDISGIPTGDYSHPASTALQVTAADAIGGGLTPLLTLTNNILGVLKVHFADDSAHLVKDTVNLATLTSLSNATDLNSAKTLLTSMHQAYEAHRTQSGVHVNNDTVTEWTGTLPTDQSSAEIFATFGKNTINDHIKGGPTVGRIAFSVHDP